MWSRALVYLTVSLFLSAVQAKGISFDANVPEDVKADSLAALTFVTDLQMTAQSPLNKMVFKSSAGPDYLNWFSERIESFGYDPDAGGAIAYNASMTTPKRMMVTDYFVKGNLPLVAKIMVLFHEARHSESKSGYWTHTNCPVPFVDEKGQDRKSILSGLPLAGKAACDHSNIGAYGISVVMMRNMERFCQNCNEKVKMDLKLYSDDQTYRVISIPEIKELEKDAKELAP